jgi:hypothetical protein
MPALNLPVHAFVGTAGSDGTTPPPGTREYILARIAQFFGAALGRLTLGTGLANDIIVSSTSQQGGLNLHNTTFFGGLAGFHFEVTSQPDPGQRALELLATPSTDTSVWASGFPGRPQAFLQASPSAEDPPAVLGGISIQGLPAAGTVDPNSALAVSVQGINGFVPALAALVTPYDVQILTQSPFTGTIQVPNDVIEPFPVEAQAFDASGNLAVSTPVILLQITPLFVTGAVDESAEAEAIRLFSFSGPAQINGFQAIFWEVGPTGSGVLTTGRVDPSLLTYTSENPCVASVDAQGRVSPYFVGSTGVKLSYAWANPSVGLSGNVSTNRRVEVISALGDFDGNGLIDQRDAAELVRIMGSVRGDPQFRDEGDFDGDGKITAADQALFDQKRASACNLASLLSPKSASPTAVAGPDQTVHAGATVHFDGSRSFDDNTPTNQLGFQWLLMLHPSGSTAALVGGTTEKPSLTTDQPGVFVVELAVRDTDGQLSRRSRVTVTALNTPPQANAGSNQTVLVGNTATLNGGGSSDADGDPLQYNWTLVSSPSGSVAPLVGSNSVQATLRPDVPGTYQIQLVVSDPFAASAPAVVTVQAMPTDQLTTATAWIGLKNSDDQGTSFDVRFEVYRDGTLVSSGQTLCVTGVTTNPSQAKQLNVSFSPLPSGVTLGSGNVVLKALTRIGTNSDGTKCAGHNNAVGLRLYEDSSNRASSIGAQIAPAPLENWFLHKTSTGSFFNATAPTGTTTIFTDSSSINFSGGNPWTQVGSWTRNP